MYTYNPLNRVGVCNTRSTICNQMKAVLARAVVVYSRFARGNHRHAHNSRQSPGCHMIMNGELEMVVDIRYFIDDRSHFESNGVVCLSGLRIDLFCGSGQSIYSPIMCVALDNTLIDKLNIIARYTFCGAKRLACFIHLHFQLYNIRALAAFMRNYDNTDIPQTES